MLNISVEIHEDGIPYSKDLQSKTNFPIYQGQVTHDMERSG